jgi:Family of unknown function (DUF5995)
MNANPAWMEAASDLTELRRPATIDEVIAQMVHLDANLDANDGLKWFNLLYLNVTRAVKVAPPTGGWADPDWLTRLDVIFADFYFQALDSAGVVQYTPGASRVPSSPMTGPVVPKVPSAWAALLAARNATGVDRIQFALAGMNAHINHDLPLALVHTRAETGRGSGLAGPQHGDFEHVNTLLAAVLPNALTFLASGLLGQLAQDTGKIGRLLAMWNVAAARELAWNNSEALQLLPGAQRTQFIETLNKLTGMASRALLLPLA